MSLIDEALRRAQSARPSGAPGPSPPADSWSAAPLPDRGRARRRIRAAAGAAAAVLLLGGAAAFLLLRGGAASEPPRVARSTGGREQPRRQAALDRAEATPTPFAETVPPARAASPRPASSPTGGASVPEQRAATAPVVGRPELVVSEGRPRVAAPATAPLASEPSLPIRSASSSPRIAAPTAPAPVPTPRVHAPAPGAASERGRAVHVGEVSVPGGHIELGGIVYSDTNPVALLNGRIVAVGGTVEGFTVVSIEESRVELTNEHRTIVLTLR